MTHDEWLAQHTDVWLAQVRADLQQLAIMARTVGLLTVEDTRARYARVTCHGLDITRRCVAADDRQHWCLLYDVNEYGHITRPVTLRVWHGPILIEFGRWV